VSLNVTRSVLLACVVVAVAGCGIDLTNGGLSCADDGPCPPGYHCSSDSTCWKNGQDPLGGGGGGDGGGSDGGDLGVENNDLSGNAPNDLSPPPDLAPTLTNGQICTSAAGCISGFCADGVCCDAACTDNCKSCNQPTSLGTCSAIASGANPAHGTCGPDAVSSCGRDGVCDGAGNCQLYGNTVTCQAGSCDAVANKATADSKCDGAGHCVTPTAIACDPYVCNGTVCYASCTTTAQCKNMTACSASQCGPKSNGSPCASGAECQSTNCVDSVCCDTPLASCGGCKQCNLAASLGSCKDVPSGQDPHNTCPTSNATCTAGGCNGSAVCTPSGNTIVCKTSCANGNQLSTTLCNGVSTGCTSSPTTAACASGLVCANGTSCEPNCSADGDSDCISTDYCSGGNCTAKVADGQSCSANDQCTSGTCGSYHRDADGDGQGVAGITMFCGASPPAGYVTNGTDCCDADVNVHQGQAGWFTTAANIGCGSNFYDYDCVGGAVPEFTGTGQCTTVGTCSETDPEHCSVTTQGWVGTQPACGASSGWATGCTHAASCACGSDPGACGSPCASNTPTGTSKTQACH
jgi:hypothetical protein